MRKWLDFFLYEFKLSDNDIRWIPFNEIGNIEHLARGGFGEVSKAMWFGHYYHGSNDKEYKERDVVLKRLYNSNDNILDILKEVKIKKKSNINVNIDLNESHVDMKLNYLNFFFS